MKHFYLTLLFVVSFFTAGFAQNEFITTWETTTANESISILTSGDGYNYTVDWGDGTIETGFIGDASHSYATVGIHTVKITGDFPRFTSSNNLNNARKLRTIEQWGTITWNSFSNAFYGCTNLDIVATDVPDLSNVTSLNQMFRNCVNLQSPDFSNWDTSNITDMGLMFANARNFNGNIGTWDVGNVTDFNSMLIGVTRFNQNISGWNIGEHVVGAINLNSMFINTENFDQNLGAWNLEKVTDISGMLDSSGLSTANYDATLIGWAENSNTPSGLHLGASNLTYCLGEAARNILADNGGLNWRITDGGLSCAATDFFVTTWRTTSSERRITIPTTGGGYNYSVDWGDGTIETGFTGNASHSYATSGIHTVRIIGDFPRIYFLIAASRDNIRSIEQWGTISWTNMEFAFAGCQNLVLNADDVPDLSLVEDLSSMFSGASTFVDNKDKMNSWDISNVRDLEQMFENAVSFNESLHNWDTSNVENMDYMFFFASSFDQSLGDWNLSNAFSLFNILDFSGISSENYDATLIGWAEQSPGDTIVSGRGVGTIRTSYCLGTDARRILTSAPHNWNITDQGQDCDFTNAFVTTWQTTTADEDITIPTTGAGYNYIVDWGDGTAITSETGNAIHKYTSAGSYDVKITGDFPRIYFNNSGDKDKILAVNQWGTQQWTSMENAFYGCSNLVLDATDTPILSQANNVSRMFNSAISLVDTQDVMNTWDVSTITTMERMFADADMFNENIASWNVGNVQNFSVMFGGADNFNQNVNDWNIGEFVTGTLNIDFMFLSTNSFNQPLNNWDVSKIGRFDFTFSFAAKFNQDLSDWDISNVNSMLGMLDQSGMSIENYEATLKGWATDTSGNVSDGIDDIPTGVRLGAIKLKYCAVEEGRAILTNTLNNWNIIGDVLDCGFEEGFITSWQTAAADETIVIPTIGDGYNYSVAWGDGTEDTSITGDASHTFTTPGTYTVKIKGDFPRIYINGNSAARDKIISVDQWGTQQWTSMESAFRRCSLLVINATDAPDLSLAKSMKKMFEMTSSLVDHGGNIGNWDVSTIENMEEVFDSSNFNENISTWNVSAVKDFSSMFFRNTSFNQNLDSWNTSAGEVFSAMFQDATAFNGAIGSWNTEQARSLSTMFNGATAFNQNISAWDVKNVGNINNAFDGATAFDQDLGSWDISSLVENTNSIQHMFSNSGMSTENYDNTLIGWARLDAGETKIPVGVSFDAENVSYCLGEAARTVLTSAPYNWIITDGGKICPEDAFITSWLLEDNDRIRIKTTSGYNYNYTIDWGDGTVDYNVTTDILHDYTTAGRYEVSITGEFPRFTLFFRLGRTLRTKIQTIEQWGNIQWRDFRDSFKDCENLKLNADDTPDLSQVTELSRMFENCTNFEDLKDRMGSWDMSTIQSIESMFAGCSIFNEDIGAWTFTNLLTAEAAFEEAITFNQDVSSWDFSQVQDIEELFSGASSFDQDLSSWDISSVTDMTGIFLNSGLSQENYDNTLIGWAALESGETQIPTNLTLDADATYCLAEAARDTLTGSLYNWIINDGGQGCVAPVITLVGDNPQVIEKGDTYTELGAEVTYGATLTINATSVDTDQAGSYTVTYDATNTVSGATATQVNRMVEVVDTTAPVITLNGPNPQIIELGDPYIELGATTDDGSAVVINASAFIDAIGSYNVTYNAMDASGNNAIEVIRTVEVVDTTAPVITLNGPNPQVIELGAGYSELGAMTDDGSAVSMDTSEFMDAVGSYTIYYDATDVNGNAAVQVTRTVEVVDTTAPVITLNGPNPQTIELGAGYSELGATTDDGAVVSINTSEFMDAIGSYTIYYDATDAAGNAAVQVTRTVEVVDTTNPTVVCQNITVQLDDTGNVSITAEMIDNGSSDLSGIVSLAIDVIDFDCATIGDNTVILTVTDANGNSDMCMATVTVEDRRAPEFDISTVPTDMNVTFDTGDMYTLTDFTDGVVVTDNCDSNRTAFATTITQSPVAGTLLAEGDHLITLTATDDNANEQTTTFTITVTDAILSVGENTEEVFTLYPNPTTDQIWIAGLHGEAQVTLSDINGRVLRTIKIKNDQSVSIADLSEGVYLIKIEQDDVYQTTRLIKN
ncbi:BspA family leucine-rich repeat surface protein [uncultured Aquimarina sp.]|uniref:BspA family leucine-rich repeat surface protein n=1 Tax=uncultured Aquimarina sp. TaxID=575652 RepID=UPI00260791A9|nr:BspA family leucine-rich repeat surface protein [uncultured Aquimarina sp.]